MSSTTNTSGAAPAATLKLPWFPWVGKKKPFYGWVIVMVGALKEFATGINGQGFATYLGPLQKEFGWNRALLAGPRSATQIEGAILGPLEGFLLDKLGPRVMVAMGTFVMGLGLMLFGLTHSLWMYFFSNIVISLGSGFASLLIISVVVNHWFRRKRSFANALVGLGFAMAGVVGVPTIVFLQTHFGWRMSAVITGFLVWAVGIPGFLLLRRQPEPFGLLPDGELPQPTTTPGGSHAHTVIEEHDFTMREALHTRSFWLLAIGQALVGLGTGAVGVHLFLHLEQGVGLSRSTGAFVWTVASTANIPSRLIGGFFGDRLPKRFVLGSAIAMVAISHFVLGLANSLPLAMTYAVLYGIGWGSRTPVANAMQGEYFGRRGQGLIRGWLQSMTVPVTIAAPVVAGYLADRMGSYRQIFVTMSFISLAGAIMTFFATPPKPPTRTPGLQ